MANNNKKKPDLNSPNHNLINDRGINTYLPSKSLGSLPHVSYDTLAHIMR